MNYGLRGIKAKNKEINAVGSKISRKVSSLLLKLAIGAAAFAIACGIAGGVGLFKSVIANTPEIHISDIIATGQASIVYDAAGNEIDQYVSQNANRIEVEWDEINEYLPLAFVAAEDERFYQHNGIDFKGIIRAGYQFALHPTRKVQGASTITQQLLKNNVFTDWMDESRVERIKRKIQEQYLAVELENALTAQGADA